MTSNEPLFSERLKDKERRVFFKCDGKKSCGSSSGCGINSDGECRHTSDIEHAVSQKYRDSKTLDEAIIHGRFAHTSSHYDYLPDQYWEKFK